MIERMVQASADYQRTRQEFIELLKRMIVVLETDVAYRTQKIMEEIKSNDEIKIEN